MTRIALAFPLAVPHRALFMHGVLDYAQRHTDWKLTISPASFSGFHETFDASLDSLAGWTGDGIIGDLTSEPEARFAETLGLPVVNLSAALRTSPKPRVMVDHRAIGQLAAKHFQERGLARFAYFGIDGPWYSELRRDGFVEQIEAGGSTCNVLETPTRMSPEQPWSDEIDQLADWLPTLQTPIGLFVVHDDSCARMVIEECLRLGLSVPHDIAVVGVDNDLVLCGFAKPTLSSVSRSGHRVGFEAAGLLARILKGEVPPTGDVLIEPDGVVRRESSDVFAVDDPHVATVMRFINEHVQENFGVERLLHCVPVSRRRLEKGFRQTLEMTPHDYICTVRVQRAKELLVRDDKLKIHEIAATCGFAGTDRFRLVFHRLVGMPPREYRRQHGSGDTVNK